MNDADVASTFTTLKSIRVGLLTWNLGGIPPPDNFDISQFILPYKAREENATNCQEESKEQDQNKITEEIDLLVVGLQEMVDLSVMGSITGKNDKERTQKWQ